MEKDFWKQVLQMQLNDNEIVYEYILKYDIQLYLFGSARISIMPNDLDILLVYPDDSKVAKALVLKKMLIGYLQEVNDIEVHMILMTVQENEEVNFVEKEDALKLQICRK